MLDPKGSNMSLQIVALFSFATQLCCIVKKGRERKKGEEEFCYPRQWWNRPWASVPQLSSVMDLHSPSTDGFVPMRFCRILISVASSDDVMVTLLTFHILLLFCPSHSIPSHICAAGGMQRPQIVRCISKLGSFLARYLLLACTAPIRCNGLRK